MFHINLKTKRVYVKYEIQKGIYNENKIERKQKTEKSMTFIQEQENKKKNQ